MFELTGQTDIATGAASGIGEVITRRLSAAGAGIENAGVDVPLEPASIVSIFRFASSIEPPATHFPAV
jgi:NAD(P)-dependent dehydrogenase (short-subunit alcohol dehydrogenase family)